MLIHLSDMEDFAEVLQDQIIVDYVRFTGQYITSVEEHPTVYD
jgi:hypothetical protein